MLPAMDQITSLRRAANGMWSGIFHCPNETVGGLPPSNIPSFRQAPAESSGCPLKCMIKAGVFVLLTIFVLYLPLGDPYTHCLEPYTMYGKQLAMCSICDLYLVSTEVASKSLEVSGEIYKTVSNLLYESKLKFYGLLDTIDRDDLCRAICCSDSTSSLDLGTKKERRACKCMKKCRLKSDAKEMQKDDVDKVLEDEITHKLGEDLLQSVARKFQVDLERSVDMVLLKIKLLLQNGTQHIQDKLLDIQGTLDTMKSLGENEVEICLTQRQNETSALAEKALHQMVVCGYALIGQDPAQAVHKVVSLKNMIKAGVKPLYEQKKEIYGLLKVCGHDHDSLKKVVKCVISKSPLIKSVMMEISGKLINGVVDLTKLMAHGAMHEACLIEVIKTIEDEAVELIKTVKKCAFGNENFANIEKYLNENNATVLNIPNEASIKNSGNLTNVKEIKDILQRMMQGKDGNSLDDTFKDKLMKLQNDLDVGNVNINAIPNDLNKGVE